MSYRADKQVIATHTHTDRHTDVGDDDTRRPNLASCKNKTKQNKILCCSLCHARPILKLHENLDGLAQDGRNSIFGHLHFLLHIIECEILHLLIILFLNKKY